MLLDAVQSTNGLLQFSEKTFAEPQSRLGLAKFEICVSQESKGIYLAQLEAIS